MFTVVGNNIKVKIPDHAFGQGYDIEWLTAFVWSIFVAAQLSLSNAFIDAYFIFTNFVFLFSCFPKLLCDMNDLDRVSGYIISNYESMMSSANTKLAWIWNMVTTFELIHWSYDFFRHGDNQSCPSEFCYVLHQHQPANKHQCCNLSEDVNLGY